MNKNLAIVVVTIHSGDLSRRAVFGPFANDYEASKWGFGNFPNNIAPNGDSVTWCWEYLISPNANLFDAIVSSID